MSSKKTKLDGLGRPRTTFSESLLLGLVEVRADTNFDRKPFDGLDSKLQIALKTIAKERLSDTELFILAKRLAELPAGGGETAENILKAMKAALAAALRPPAENGKGAAEGDKKAEDNGADATEGNESKSDQVDPSGDADDGVANGSHETGHETPGDRGVHGNETGDELSMGSAQTGDSSEDVGVGSEDNGTYAAPGEGSQPDQADQSESVGDTVFDGSFEARHATRDEPEAHGTETAAARSTDPADTGDGSVEVDANADYSGVSEATSSGSNSDQADQPEDADDTGADVPVDGIDASCGEPDLDVNVSSEELSKRERKRLLQRMLEEAAAASVTAAAP
jgi:hypothetical protein